MNTEKFKGLFASKLCIHLKVKKKDLRGYRYFTQKLLYHKNWPMELVLFFY